MERLLSMMRITNEFPTRSVVRRTEKMVLKTISSGIVTYFVFHLLLTTVGALSCLVIAATSVILNSQCVERCVECTHR